MLERKELKEITLIRDDKPCFVSLYLNVNPLTNPRGDYAIKFKNMMKATIDALEKNVFKLVREDLEKMESYVLGNKRQFKKGLVLLSSTRNSFWKEFQLWVPVKSELIVDSSPFVKPLLDILDDYKWYVALLVDKESARIFVIHIGEIVEYGEVHTPDIPGKHKKGGWFALSQNHYERHIDYHVGLHLKDVVKKLDSFLSAEKIERIIIGGSDEAVSMTKELLPGTILDKVVATFRAEMFAKADEILAKAEQVVQSVERRQETEIADRLVAQALKNEKAVLGIDDVLHALQAGNVMKLVYIRESQFSGYACKNCRALSSQEIKACLYCKGEMERANYMAEMVLQKAMEQGAQVEAVAESRKLSEVGGIGAFLRF